MGENMVTCGQIFLTFFLLFPPFFASCYFLCVVLNRPQGEMRFAFLCIFGHVFKNSKNVDFFGRFIFSALFFAFLRSFFVISIFCIHFAHHRCFFWKVLKLTFSSQIHTILVYLVPFCAFWGMFWYSLFASFLPDFLHIFAHLLRFFAYIFWSQRNGRQGAKLLVWERDSVTISKPSIWHNVELWARMFLLTILGALWFQTSLWALHLRFLRRHFLLRKGPITLPFHCTGAKVVQRVANSVMYDASHALASCCSIYFGPTWKPWKPENLKAPSARTAQIRGRVAALLSL